MNSKLIDIHTGIEIKSKKTNVIMPQKNIQYFPIMTKREFLILTLLTTSGISLLNKKVEANPLLGFLAAVGSLIAGSIVRGIARFIGKKIVRKVIGAGVTSYAALPRRAKSRVVEEVVSDLAEAGIKHASKKIVHAIASDQSEALWAKSDKKNPLVLKIENHTENTIETPIKLALKTPYSKRRYDVKKGMILQIAPFDKAEFKIRTFIDLPSTGLKHVVSGIPTSYSRKITIKTSEKITVMRTVDIYT